MKSTRLAYIYLGLAMLIVGTSVVVGKVISSSLPIFFSSFLSLIIATILFLPTLIKEKAFKKITKNDLFYLFLQALLGTVLYRIFLFVGLKYIDSSYAGILTALQPAMISLLAFGFLKEKQSTKQIVGVVLAVIGLLITYTSNSLKIDITSGLFIGTVLVLLSIFGEACFSIFAKKLSLNIKPFAIAGIVTVLSTILMIPLAIYDIIKVGIPTFTTIEILSVVYYGVFLTYVSFILWFKGLENVKAGVAGIFTALVPVSGLLFAASLLKDYPSGAEIIGAILIITSIILVVYKNGK